MSKEFCETKTNSLRTNRVGPTCCSRDRLHSSTSFWASWKRKPRTQFAFDFTPIVKKAATESGILMSGDWIIHPITLEEFNRKYLQRDVLCISRNTPAYFQQKLGTLANLSNLLNDEEYYWGLHGAILDTSSCQHDGDDLHKISLGEIEANHRGYANLVFRSFWWRERWIAPKTYRKKESGHSQRKKTKREKRRETTYKQPTTNVHLINLQYLFTRPGASIAHWVKRGSWFVMAGRRWCKVVCSNITSRLHLEIHTNWPQSFLFAAIEWLHNNEDGKLSKLSCSGGYDVHVSPNSR